MAQQVINMFNGSVRTSRYAVVVYPEKRDRGCVIYANTIRQVKTVVHGLKCYWILHDNMDGSKVLTASFMRAQKNEYEKDIRRASFAKAPE